MMMMMMMMMLMLLFVVVSCCFMNIVLLERQGVWDVSNSSHKLTILAIHMLRATLLVVVTQCSQASRGYMIGFRKF